MNTMERHAHFSNIDSTKEIYKREESELPSIESSIHERRKRRNTRDNFNRVFLLSGSRKNSNEYNPIASTSERHGIISVHTKAKEHDHRPNLEVHHMQGWIFGKVLDPRSHWIQRWNKVLLLTYAIGAAIDPLFLYIVAIDIQLKCVYIEGWFATMVTVLRNCHNVMYLFHMFTQLKLAYVSKESMVLGRGMLVYEPKLIAKNYLHPRTGSFIYDLFMILPIPELGLWVIIPSMINKGKGVYKVITFLLVTFLFQYIPKIAHLVVLMRRLQRVTGYIFGTPWWGFVLNMIAYFISAHVAGAIWYLLTMQQVSTCIASLCEDNSGCRIAYLGCPKPILYGSQSTNDLGRMKWGKNDTIFATCLGPIPTYVYAIYAQAVPLVTERSKIERILYPLFWGLMTLSTFGNNLIPSDHMLEVTFCIFIVVCGLLLFMLLIGNIQVFLSSINTRKEAMQVRFRDLEWWMKRRQLPPRLRHRVIHFERERWAALRGVDEEAMIQDLPESLRRDIKRHLCLDLIKKVPMFEELEELVLDNMCQRLKALLFIKNELVLREGDPVHQMLFVVRGTLQTRHVLYNNQISTCNLGPGQFCGDELISWCLRTPSEDRLPPSTSTIVSLGGTEVFAFEYQDLKYVIDHFRYLFETSKMKAISRYYSTSWRTWAAVTIQYNWKKIKERKRVLQLGKPEKLKINISKNEDIEKQSDEENPSISESRMRQIVAMLIPKPSILPLFETI